ncbi:MAG: ATP cone domain-containing protein [Actinomycetota bacterium]|nr:ATP cone domain-containing protein [Actinomycetota bacterium]
MSERYVWVEDRHGTRLPYSKGLLASSIMTTGLPPEEAHKLAEAVELELWARDQSTITSEELVELASSVLAERAGPEVASRYLAWRMAKRSARPLIVLLGGATGAGKSTIATRLGTRLGITRIIPTDAVREVMRNIFATNLMPTLYVSSFQAHTTLRAPVPEDHDAVVVGFRQQAEAVAVGLVGLIDRAVRERTDLIIEGVHVLPGLFRQAADRWGKEAVMTEVVLSVPDRQTHLAQLQARGSDSELRQSSRYLEHFEEIRRIQRYIRRLATSHGVPEVLSRGLDETIQDVLDFVVARVTEVRDELSAPGGVRLES